jgi:hypothetical protein
MEARMKKTPAALALSVLAATPAFAQELSKPVRLEAGGKPIDTDIGHATPALYDWDGDGKRDLLVGQFGGGKMKIFKNTGTNAKPAFAAEEWFTAGDKVVTTPTG